MWTDRSGAGCPNPLRAFSDNAGTGANGAPHHAVATCAAFPPNARSPARMGTLESRDRDIVRTLGELPSSVSAAKPYRPATGLQINAVHQAPAEDLALTRRPPEVVLSFNGAPVVAASVVGVDDPFRVVPAFDPGEDRQLGIVPAGPVVPVNGLGLQ